jgi:hypothetical protein
MQNALRTALAALAVGALVAPAAADMKVYYHVGSWDAFSGPGTDGKMVCGVGSTNPSDSRAFSLRFEIGSDTVQLQAKKPTWTIPSGTQLPVVVQIGLNTPWNFQGSGDGQVIQWPLDRSDMQTFDAQFRQASSMTVSFPSGNEPPWTVGLTGSTAASNAFGRCVTALTQRTSGQPAAAAPAGPTQPYGEAPTQPTTVPPAPATTHP